MSHNDLNQSCVGLGDAHLPPFLPPFRFGFSCQVALKLEKAPAMVWTSNCAAGLRSTRDKVGPLRPALSSWAWQKLCSVLLKRSRWCLCPASISPPLPPTLKWICGASQDKKKKMSEWREETEAEERGGQAGRQAWWGRGVWMEQCGCPSVRSGGSSGQKVQMCECERGFRFWLKACLGERAF